MNLRYKPGLRAVKTALAVLLCLLSSQLLGRSYAFYSCIAAVVCMQPTAEKSLHAGIHRFIGTLIGGLVGFLLLESSKPLPADHGWAFVFIIPLFLLLAIYLCNILGRKDSAAICCIVFLNIATNFDRGMHNSLLYVADRVIDTSIGIVFAVLVNRFVFPRRSKEALRTDPAAPPVSETSESAPRGE